MSLSAILYYGSLVLCISVSPSYKAIDNIEVKRNYGTGIGILLSLLICGHYIYHSLLMILGNIMIIKNCDRRHIHKLSLAYTWIYLMYVHYIMNDEYIIWIYQTLALKLVGVAFEIHDSENKFEQQAATSSYMGQGTFPADPSTVDIITYAFFFVGLHKGPYYRIKIFQDHFEEPLALPDCWVITERKLKKACVCGLIYLILRMKYTEETYTDPNFLQSYGADFLFLYNLPLLLMYLLQYEIVMMLCTSVFTETGFGVYPAKYQAIPGYGPSRHQSTIKLTSKIPNVDYEDGNDCSMLRCFHNEKLFIGPKMRDTLKSWDMPSRYFFWAYVYKGVVKSNKEVRSAISFLAWTIWSGITLPKVILSLTLWVYVHLEAEYSALYPVSGSMKIPWDIGFSIMRLFCLLYLTPCLIIRDTHTVLRYYNSIFWVYHFIILFLMIAAVIIYKTRQRTV